MGGDGDALRLASHSPRVTDISGSPPTGSYGLGEGDEHLPSGVW